MEHPDTEVATACFMIDCVETAKLGWNVLEYVAHSCTVVSPALLHTICVPIVQQANQATVSQENISQRMHWDDQCITVLWTRESPPLRASVHWSPITSFSV